MTVSNGHHKRPSITIGQWKSTPKKDLETTIIVETRIITIVVFGVLLRKNPTIHSALLSRNALKVRMTEDIAAKYKDSFLLLHPEFNDSHMFLLGTAQLQLLSSKCAT